ncbi:IS200/IS605 family element transposase accessory protein TnpB [Trichocoleus sp. FACHB-90]|uniref:RNA-guided endonuclease InsQ/TnpB family protein n=1 Tax=Cyanophyceae TaxID=3028117 RepID=UPI001687A076|nr:RNA-guided endonuclease TnpB family protein [Trichocoleus sp. FACHB-90]MBD1926436.1 IS200/IS605 family element transposase accessory protein TnpB [Trichocoleus sp. FACHB-90]
MNPKAYRYRFYPSEEQEQLLRRTLGCVRLVYNKALHTRTEAWYERQERVDYKQTSGMLTQWKKQEDLQFLNEVSSVPLQQGLRNLQKAFTNFWAGHARYPNFKKKRSGGSAEFTRAAFRWKDGQLWLAKCSEPLPIRWSRTLLKGCEPSTVTLRLDASGRWFVSLLVEDHTVKSLPKVDKAVGIDAGITSLIATSDGEKIANPKHFKRLRHKLRKAQKALSRKVKGSNNREKARHKVARIQAAIADARKDFLHKLTTRLVRENQTIAVEDLAVKNMMKNHKLAQAIADASWSELVRQLEYKCQWYGRTLVKIDRWFPSSKRCGKCGHVVDKMRLDVREWDCPECGTHHDRDINAAQNILAAGLAVIVCGANVRPDGHKPKGQLRKSSNGRKQKPKL